MPSSSGSLLAAGAGGGHRSVDSTSRRNLLAVGGVAALAGQMAFSHLLGSSATLLPSPAALVGIEPTESTITELAAVDPLVSTHDGLEPVSLGADSSTLQQADAARLAKAAGLAEAALAAQEQADRQAVQAQAVAADSPRVRGTKCAPNTAGLAGVKSWVSTAGVELRCIFGVGTVGGLGGRSNVSDHPLGLAVDFMTTGASGDELADYALKYKDELKVKYVIWKQRINFGDGWHGMENRGSATANHFDHVHVSFLS
ncbi:MAG: hypothetical protein ACR2G2_00900 [Pseudonocardia sp.]